MMPCCCRSTSTNTEPAAYGLGFSRMPRSSRWALGVLIFELVMGYPPFYDDDKVTMYKNITELSYYMPKKMSKVGHCSAPVDK